MKCSEIKKLIPQYTRNELSQAQQQSIEMHLAACLDCRAAMDDYRFLLSKSRHPDTVPETPDLVATTMERIKSMSNVNSTDTIDTIKSSTHRWLRLAMVVTVAIIVLAIVLVTQLLNTFPSPQNVMAKTYAATLDIKSFRFSGTSMSQDSDGFSSQQSFEAEYASPDRYHVEMTENGQGSEFIIIGDEQYISGRHFGAALFGLTQGLTRSVSKEAVLSYLGNLTDIQALPDEAIENVNCLHYLGKWDVEKQIAETKRSLMEYYDEVGIEPDEEEIDKQLEKMHSIEMKIELWIGRDDYLIRQLKMNEKLPDDDEGLGFSIISVTMKYYDLNQPVNIEAPLDADGQLLPGWQLVDTS